MLKCALLLVSGALLCGPASSAPAQTQAPTILVFGDSISAAYGMRVEEGWVALLRKKLEREGYGWQVVNASVSGETTDGGRARLPRALKLHQPKVLILELGANDGLRGLPVEKMTVNLKAMVADARAAGAKVLLVGLPLPPNYGPLYMQRFRAAFRELAREQALPFVPFELDEGALKMQMLQEDGLHPTARAQPRLLDAIWPVLRDALQESQ